MFIRPIAGGVAAYTGPGSPLNKVAGLGFGGPVDDATLAEIERAFAERKAAVQVELSTLADPSIAPQLTRRGYALVGFENVSGLSLPADTSPAVPGTDVAHCDEESFDRWIDVMVAGFAAPDTQGVPSRESFERGVMEQIFRDTAGASGFIHYLARRDGAVAGGASMRMHDGIAQLCGAATLPEHRRHGVQSTLLTWRLTEATARGCELAVVTTQPGSKSQQNMHRFGFELLYTRAILVRNP